MLPLPKSDLGDGTLDPIVEGLSQGDGLARLVHGGHLSLVHSQRRTAVDGHQTTQPIGCHLLQRQGMLFGKEKI